MSTIKNCVCENSHEHKVHQLFTLISYGELEKLTAILEFLDLEESTELINNNTVYDIWCDPPFFAAFRNWHHTYTDCPGCFGRNGECQKVDIPPERRKAIIDLLLKYGADFSVFNGAGHTMCNGGRTLMEYIRTELYFCDPVPELFDWFEGKIKKEASKFARKIILAGE